MFSLLGYRPLENCALCSVRIFEKILPFIL